jgi:membrane-associated PAP2 superfamily phosphatase
MFSSRYNIMLEKPDGSLHVGITYQRSAGQPWHQNRHGRAGQDLNWRPPDSTSRRYREARMNRIGLAIALIVGALTAAISGLYPEIDPAISGLFFEPASKSFTPHLNTFIFYSRQLALCIIGVFAVQAIATLVIKFLLPRSRSLMPGRAAMLIVVTFILGPGLVTNVLLKDHWGRPRPGEVTQFGGADHFLQWWDPGGPCKKNCSFVAGDPSAAFWTLASAATAPLPYRPAAYAAALLFGAAVGVLRIIAGGHFFTDVMFAGIITFLVIWIVHGFIYRWRATRSSDSAIEDAIARSGLVFHGVVAAAITAVFRITRGIGRRISGG